MADFSFHDRVRAAFIDESAPSLEVENVYDDAFVLKAGQKVGYAERSNFSTNTRVGLKFNMGSTRIFDRYDDFVPIPGMKTVYTIEKFEEEKDETTMQVKSDGKKWIRVKPNITEEDKILLSEGYNKELVVVKRTFPLEYLNPTCGNLGEMLHVDGRLSRLDSVKSDNTCTFDGIRDMVLPSYFEQSKNETKGILISSAICDKVKILFEKAYDKAMSPLKTEYSSVRRIDPSLGIQVDPDQNDTLTFSQIVMVGTVTSTEATRHAVLSHVFPVNFWRLQERGSTRPEIFSLFIGFSTVSDSESESDKDSEDLISHANTTVHKDYKIFNVATVDSCTIEKGKIFVPKETPEEKRAGDTIRSKNIPLILETNEIYNIDIVDSYADVKAEWKYDEKYPSYYVFTIVDERPGIQEFDRLNATINIKIDLKFDDDFRQTRLRTGGGKKYHVFKSMSHYFKEDKWPAAQVLQEKLVDPLDGDVEFKNCWVQKEVLSFKLNSLLQDLKIFKNEHPTAASAEYRMTKDETIKVKKKDKKPSYIYGSMTQCQSQFNKRLEKDAIERAQREFPAIAWDGIERWNEAIVEYVTTIIVLGKQIRESSPTPKMSGGARRTGRRYTTDIHGQQRIRKKPQARQQNTLTIEDIEEAFKMLERSGRSVSDEDIEKDLNDDASDLFLDHTRAYNGYCDGKVGSECDKSENCSWEPLASGPSVGEDCSQQKTEDECASPCRWNGEACVNTQLKKWMHCKKKKKKTLSGGAQTDYHVIMNTDSETSRAFTNEAYKKQESTGDTDSEIGYGSERTEEEESEEEKEESEKEEESEEEQKEESEEEDDEEEMLEEDDDEKEDEEEDDEEEMLEEEDDDEDVGAEEEKGETGDEDDEDDEDEIFDQLVD